MTKRSKKIVNFLLGTACACCITAGVAGGFVCGRQAFLSSLAENAVLDCEGEWKNEYKVGETFSAPTGVIEVNGQRLNAEAFVVFPDGNVTGKTQVKLMESGQYTVEYKAQYAGETFSLKKDFTVLEPAYAVDGETSSLSYGSLERYPLIDGLCVDLAQGDTFTYNKVLNLNGKTKSDKLFGVNITPSTVGAGDAQVMTFVFTDIYDTDNFVTVQVKMDLQTDYYGLGVYTPRVYVTANANGQSPVGFFRDATNGKYEYKGQKYTIQNANSGTLVAGIGFAGQDIVLQKDAGKYNPSELEYIGERIHQKNNETAEVYIASYDQASKEFGIAFDYEERAVYLYRAEGNAAFVVADLDEVGVFGEKNLWDGFTTGEVFMSVSADRYVSEKFSFVLREIQGDTLENDINDFEYTMSLVVEDGGVEYPEASVGKSYPVYPAKAYHIKQGELPVQTRVFFGYDSGARFEVNVKDGRFTPMAEGIYTVEYSATDKFGKRVVKRVDVTAKANDAPLRIDLSEDFQDEYAVGEIVTVAAPTYHSAYAAYGINASVVARLKGGSTEYPIDDTLTFRPMYAGTYEICYICEDFVETVERKYEITVSANGAPIVTQTIATPKYVIKNAKIVFDDVYGFCFENGQPVRKQAALSVEEYADKNETAARTVPVTDAYTVGDCKYVKLKYDVNGTLAYSDYIPVVDVGFGSSLDMSKYFVATKGEIAMEKAGKYLLISTDEQKSAQGEVAFDFINRVLAYDFEFVFAGAEESAPTGFERFEIVLTDYYDSSIALSIAYAPKANGTDVYLNGAHKASLAMINSNNKFSLKYDNGRFGIVSPQVGTNVNVYTDANGKEFTGFPSGYVNVSFAWKGVQAASALRFTAIGNQALNKDVKDWIKPMMYIQGKNLSPVVGDRVAIPTVYCADVLDTFTSLSFTVETPNRQIAVSTDGVRLENVLMTGTEYLLDIEEYGIYYVTYKATDSSGKWLELTYSLSVADHAPPTVRLLNKQTQGKVGAEISVATAEVRDNSSATENIRVIVALLSPDGLMKTVVGGKFKAEKKGIYTVYYHVTDEKENTVIVSYTIRIGD